MKIFYMLSALLFVVAGVATAAESDFQAGVRILDSGNSIGAAEHFKRCSDQGELRCQIAYASFLQRGEGVLQDRQAAFDLYYLAALKGDATAQLNIGEFYEKGDVVVADIREAAIWYSLAALQGRTWAVTRKELVSAQLTAEDLAMVQQRVQEFSVQNRG